MKLIKNIGFCICICLPVVAMAQPGQLRMGFLFSPGISWISNQDPAITSAGSNLSADIAARVEVGFAEQFSLVTGLGLSFHRGGTLRYATGGNFLPNSSLSSSALNTGQKPLPNGTRIRYNAQYLEFPVGVKWRSAPVGPVRLYAELPITSGIAIQRRGAIMAGDINTEKENFAKDFRPVNISWGLGCGIEYPLGDEKALVAGIHFTRGFNDVTGNEAWTAVPNPDNNPFTPDDDYILLREDSKAVISAFSFRVGLLF